MRKVTGGFEKAAGFENIVFATIALVLLLSAAVVAALEPHLHLANGRVLYGMHHLPAALLAAFLFTALIALLRPFLSDRLRNKPTVLYLSILIAVFCLFWLPALLEGGLDEDDWMLLAAASIRKVIVLHPAWSWHALDSVDGNFRPLGTVLYFGYLFHAFGAQPGPYLAGLFLVNLLGCLLPFLIVRALGYSSIAGMAAAILFLSRSMTYTIRTWPSALGDALVILFCGVMALALLQAIRRRGLPAIAFHLLAWTCFVLATLSKQSAFAAPLIVALLLFLEPGQTQLRPLRRRATGALLGLAVYGATAAAAFFHAKSLAETESPYPIGFSWEALLRTFAYPTWYLFTFDFPPRIVLLRLAPSLLGLAIVAGVLLFLWKVPRALGDRPRDVVFCLLAAAASISLFIVLSNRLAPYYGSMSAFWISIALGIVLTRFGPVREGHPAARLCAFLFCLLAVTGFTDIRLKQTGLLPSGGYTWGTFTSTFNTGVYHQIDQQLAAAPQTSTLVLADMPGYPSQYACMALVAAPQLKRILVYDSRSHTYLANDLQGARPKDEFAALNDPAAYNWTRPIDSSAAAASLPADGPQLTLKFRNGKIERED